MTHQILHCNYLEAAIPADVDMIFADLPYNKTSVICDQEEFDLGQFLEWADSVLKDSGVMALTAVQPFTTKLCSLLIDNNWKFYTLIWEKGNATNHMRARKQPLCVHEDIIIAYGSSGTYNPQMTVGTPYVWSSQRTSSEHFVNCKNDPIVNTGTRFPRSVRYFKQERGLHPLQKPVSLIDWLIRSYTNEDELVVDPTCGSGSSGVAAIQSGRNYIGIEIDEAFAALATNRLNDCS